MKQTEVTPSGLDSVMLIKMMDIEELFLRLLVSYVFMLIKEEPFTM